MRVRSQANGVTVKAYAGTTGVLLAFNVNDQKRPGLLGFAIERKGADESGFSYLDNLLAFPQAGVKPGERTPSNKAPIQKFRWSDYRVYPGCRYEYIVHPVYGSWDKTQVEPGPLVAVNTAPVESGEHKIIFNRAAGASQAFSWKFADVVEALADAKKHKTLQQYEPPANVKAWLSRGVLEQILAFIDQAVGSRWALDIAIYEYELEDIVRAVEAAAKRGVKIRLIYHAKPGDKQTSENASNLEGLQAHDSAEIIARKTDAIFHDKFIVLSKMEGEKRRPLSVLCGSTNFTYNGVYCQANVVHVAENEGVAQSYLALFNQIAEGADPKATRQFIDKSNCIDCASPLFVGFSPRSGRGDLGEFTKIIGSAGRDVLFCTAFEMDRDIDEALLGSAHDSILRYGLSNRKSDSVTGYHADRTADFVATAYLDKGLEGWLRQAGWRQEVKLNRGGNILVHTKVVVVDFTSDSPTVISGSHNLSNNASAKNDENYLIIRGNSDVADCYGCEVMRLYDHYRFRYKVNDSKPDKPLALAEDSSWTDRYFGGDDLATKDREVFSA